tara:strand:- start:25841 stop:26515 length:675 start_codon:yes stop_codon:yes gene_type:complete
MGSLAIIPARGGSKRLKKKNIIEFHGAPIISYTINSALKSNCFDRIVISTDDQEIYDISSKYHDDVVFRPKKLATDKSTVNDVCYNFLKCELKKNIKYNFLTVLYPTAPMRTSKDIKGTLDKLTIERYTSSLAVTTFSHPVHQAFIIRNGQSKKLFPKLFNLRESKVPNYYVDNGSTYSVNVKSFIKTKNIITKKPGLYIMPPERSIDIDTPNQLEMARYFYKK